MKLFQNENKPVESNSLLSNIYKEFEKLSFLSSNGISQNVLENTILLYRKGNIQIIDQIISELMMHKYALDESVIVAVTDTTGKIIYVNRKFCEISKFSEEELIGQTHRILKSGHHPPEFYREMWTTISSGKRWEGEIKNRAKDGSFYWVKTMILPIMDKKGHLQRHISFRTDITKQKELENKLHQITDILSTVEQKYHTLFENAPNIVLLVDSVGFVVDCNIESVKSLKYQKDEIIGRSFFNFIPEVNFAEITKMFDDWKTNGNTIDNGIVMKRKDGYDIHTLMSMVSSIDGNQQICCIVAKDISEISKAKEEIKNLKQNRLTTIGEMSAHIAHDLRNPLSVIKNSLEILTLRLERKLDEKDRSEIARTQRAVSRMAHQIEDVMDYVRISPLDYAYNSLPEILNSSLKGIAIPQQIKIIWKNVENVTIICDYEKLEIVFVNLIQNAIPAIGENIGQITINYQRLENHHLIEIIDSGSGINEEDLKEVFEPLFTTRQKGTGLGLTSCKNIIEQHGGTISVKNNPTTFTLRIPIEYIQQN